MQSEPGACSCGWVLLSAGKLVRKDFLQEEEEKGLAAQCGCGEPLLSVPVSAAAARELGEVWKSTTSSSPGTGKSRRALSLLAPPPQSLTRCLLRPTPVRMPLLHPSFSHGMSCCDSELLCVTRMRRGLASCRFIPVPSSVACWCEATVPVTCGQAAMLGSLVLGGGGEGPCAAIAPLQVGQCIV